MACKVVESSCWSWISIVCTRETALLVNMERNIAPEVPVRLGTVQCYGSNGLVFGCSSRADELGRNPDTKSHPVHCGGPCFHDWTPTGRSQSVAVSPSKSLVRSRTPPGSTPTGCHMDTLSREGTRGETHHNENIWPDLDGICSFERCCKVEAVEQTARKLSTMDANHGGKVDGDKRGCRRP